MLGKGSSKNIGFRGLVAVLILFTAVIGSAGRAAASTNAGVVYTMTNSASGNAIQEYDRLADGALTLGGAFATGGLGTGAGLGSQGAIALSPDGSWLFAVNAGSNEISSFSVQAGQLTLMDKVASGGSIPISLTYYQGLLYVLNTGSAGNIAGFRVQNGHLTSLAGSTRLLSNNGSGAAPSPEQISFNPNGSFLVVTEKGSGLIDTYPVVNGLAYGPTVNASSGPTPYGFGFGKNSILVVSEAAHSSVSSYRVSDTNFKVISPSVPDNQGAACWLIVTSDSQYAYTANAASGTISGYRIGSNGRLSLLDADGITGVTGAGSHPIDLALSAGNRFLYILSAGTQMVSAFSAHSDGSLTFIGNVPAPAAVSGLVAK